MAGGFGTRLRPLTNNIPKPMVPVVNKPMLEHLITLLKLHNINDFVVLLFYQPDIIRNYFKDGSEFGVKITYVEPKEDYGTAGAVKLSEKYIKDNFLVISGDVLTNFNLTDFYNFHKDKDSTATISLYSSENPLQYGIVLTNNEHKIVRFLEKPSSSEVFSDTINTGIYYFKKDVFQYIPEGESFDFSKDLFPLLLEKGVPLYGYKSEGYWRDVGNLEEYLYANLDALKGDLGYINERDYYGNCVSPSARIDGRNTTIENCIIGDKVVIEKDVVLKNSIIWDNVVLGERSNVLFDVIGKNTTIGANTRVNDFVFIGDNCKIGKNVFVSSGIKIWDKKKVDDKTKITRSLIYEDTFFDELFTDARISGHSNLQVNPEFASKLGTVYGAYIGQSKTVLVGRDVDEISNMIKRSISSGILSSGVNVIDLQTVAIPIMRQELKAGRGSGGIFVRKSPFDKDTTDIIFLDKDGRDISSGKTKSIERLFFGEDYRRADFLNVGKFTYPERTNEKYREQFLSCLNLDVIKKRKFKLVIDYTNGIASTIFPEILGEFNCNTVSLSAHLEKGHITRTVEEFYKAKENFQFVVQSLGYDLGFMIDAGGEKIWLATDEGMILNGDRFLVLTVKLFLNANPDVKKIAVPVQASKEVDIVAEEYGVEVLRVKDSHYSMMIACDDKNVGFVGGTKGGFLFPKFLYATDGMFTVAKLLELIAKCDKPISQLEKEIPVLYMKKENIDCTKEDKGMIMRKFMEDTMNLEQELIDGVRVKLSKTDTMLCIPDKARNIVHLNIETDSEEKSNNLINEYKQKIESYIK